MIDDLELQIEKAINECKIEKTVDKSVQTYIHYTLGIRNLIQNKVVSYTQSELFHTTVVELCQAILHDMSAENNKPSTTKLIAIMNYI